MNIDDSNGMADMVKNPSHYELEGLEPYPMKTKEELREIRERNYDTWFKRFVKKQDLVKRIEVSNEQGYMAYVLNVHDYRDRRDKRMAMDPLFIKKLQTYLHGYKVSVDEGVTERMVFGITTKRSYYKIKISWADSEA